METKANTALIGAFTLVVLALGFVFVYWLARGAGEDTNAHLTVIFEDPVTGLSVGSQVVFNGIKIGDVKTLDLDPQNPKVVIAGLDVTPKPSVKADTQVTLGFQGLTGVGYIEMAGGSPSLPPIWEAQPNPTIIATRSSMQDLLSGARTILSRADETLQKLGADRSPTIPTTSRSRCSTCGNSPARSRRIPTTSASWSPTSPLPRPSIADATTRLDGIVDKSETLIAAINPDDVRQTIANIRTTSDSFAAQAGRLGEIIDRADAVAADAQAFSQHLPALGDKAEALLAASIRRSSIARSTTSTASPRRSARTATTSTRSSPTPRTSRRASRSSATAPNSLLTKLDSMAGQGPGGILQDASDDACVDHGRRRQFQQADLAARQRPRRFQRSRAARLQNLVARGRGRSAASTASSPTWSNNPTGFLLGGENVPEYGGRRR